jgi:hypothetical protein
MTHVQNRGHAPNGRLGDRQATPSPPHRRTAVPPTALP